MKKLPFLAVVIFGVPSEEVHPHLAYFPHLQTAVDRYNCRYIHLGDDITIEKIDTALRLHALYVQKPAKVLLVSGHPLPHSEQRMSQALSMFRHRFDESYVVGMHLGAERVALL